MLEGAVWLGKLDADREQSEFVGCDDAAGLPDNSLDNLRAFLVGSWGPLATLFKLQRIMVRILGGDGELIHGRAYRSFRDESRAYISSVTEMTHCSPYFSVSGLQVVRRYWVGPCPPALVTIRYGKEPTP